MTRVYRRIEDRVKLCNCARCTRVLLGESMIGQRRLGEYQDLPYVYIRLQGRPLCLECHQQLTKGHECEGQHSLPLAGSSAG